ARTPFRATSGNVLQRFARKPPLAGFSVRTRTYLATCHAALLHRARAGDQGHRRIHRPGGPPPADGGDRPRVGRRDPRRRARRPLRQGRRGSRRRRPLDARRLARLPRSRPPGLEQGLPPEGIPGPGRQPPRGAQDRRGLPRRRRLRIRRGLLRRRPRHRRAVALRRAPPRARRRGPRALLLGPPRLRQLVAAPGARTPRSASSTYLVPNPDFDERRGAKHHRASPSKRMSTTIRNGLVVVALVIIVIAITTKHDGNGQTATTGTATVTHVADADTVSLSTVGKVRL